VIGNLCTFCILEGTKPWPTEQKSREILGRVSSLIEKKALSLSICVGAMCLPSGGPHFDSLKSHLDPVHDPHFYIKDRDAELYHPIIT
jgi:hypothetical protein